MKYLFELSETPVNVAAPITMQKQLDTGVKSAKSYISIEDLIEALRQLQIEQGFMTEGNVDDFSAAFADNYSGNITDFRTNTALPFGTIHFVEGTNKTSNISNEIITVVAPKGIFPTQLNGVAGLLGFPTLVFKFHLVGHENEPKRIIAGRVYAVKEQPHRIDENTQLFIFPFPNVEKGNGNICWGTALTSVRATERTSYIPKIIDAFYTSFNNDYGILLDSAEFVSFDSYFTACEGKPFDDNLLVPAPNNMTVKGLTQA